MFRGFMAASGGAGLKATGCVPKKLLSHEF
jgi:hypothetical protein